MSTLLPLRSQSVIASLLERDIFACLVCVVDEKGSCRGRSKVWESLPVPPIFLVGCGQISGGVFLALAPNHSWGKVRYE